MKHFLLFLILCSFICACSKNKDLDKNCGVVLQVKKTSELNDGGFVEWVSIATCGPALKYYVDRAQELDVTIFYKGQTRAKAQYMVCRLGSNLTRYIRYESGTIPESSIKYYEDKGYEVTVKEMTGIEELEKL